MDEGGVLRSGLERGQALAHLLVVTSFGTYSELHQEGLSDAKLTRQLQADARLLLLGKS